MCMCTYYVLSNLCSSNRGLTGHVRKASTRQSSVPVRRRKKKKRGEILFRQEKGGRGGSTRKRKEGEKQERRVKRKKSHKERRRYKNLLCYLERGQFAEIRFIPICRIRVKGLFRCYKETIQVRNSKNKK